MHLLITAGASPLSRFLADILGREHTVRLTDRIPIQTGREFVQSPLSHDHGSNLLVRGMDAIVHVLDPLPGEAAASRIDYATRCTYNLLWAAAQEGAPRVVLLSSLDLMDAYAETYTVAEHWRPHPSPELQRLIPHLAEATCKEFAREAKVAVTVLRLGHVYAVGQAMGDDAMGVDMRDVSQAVARTLQTPTGNWSIFHIQHDGVGARFSVAQARRALGYQPANWHVDSHGFSTGRRS